MPHVAAAAGTTGAAAFLGRFGDRKGVPELLRALAEPRLATLRWTAVLAGDGAVERFRARWAARAERARSRCRLGRRSRGPRQLAAADILVLPSLNEGLPMAVLEAMAPGLAVVTTPVGAIPDAIQDGETGLLVPARDAAALAEALARLIVDPALRRRLGEQARARFAAEFSIDAYGPAAGAIYAAALERPGPAAVRPA